MNVLYLSNYNIDIGDNTMTYDVNYQEELHKMNEMNRAKLKDIDEQLKLLS